MTDETAKPADAKTGALWGVLLALLVFGAVGAATCVDGVLGAISGAWTGVVIAAFGALVAFLALLFMIGVLYRVDRYRGALGRRVPFFE